MIDISVFKSLLKQETYNKYKHIIFQIPSMDTEMKLILNSIRTYYETYSESEEITVDELKLHFTNQNPAIRDPELYDELLSRLYDADINNVELLITSINRLSEIATANVILHECIELTNSYQPEGLSKIAQHLEKFKALSSTVVGSEADVCRLTLEELLHLDSSESGINWEIEFLRDTIGPLKAGTLGHVFAYPETGKTSLGLFEATHMASRLIEPDSALYLGNEEPVTRSKLRAYSALFNREPDRIRDNSPMAMKLWDEKIGDKLKFIDQVSEIHKVEQYVSDFKPRIVFIDQGAKVNIPGDYSDVKRLQQLYNNYRNLAVKYNTVIVTLGQASADCINKKFLQLNHMDSSKIGIPGELDFAIGVGSIEEIGYEEVRYLSVCKNKLKGTHGKGEVTFKYKTCNFSGNRRR